MMITEIKTKQDLVKALGQRELAFVAEIEVVNDDGLKTVNDKARTMLRQKKKLHVILVERD